MSLTGSQWSEISLEWSLRRLNGSQWLRSQLMKTLMNTSIYQIYLPHISYIYELYFQNCAINGWIIFGAWHTTIRGTQIKTVTFGARKTQNLADITCEQSLIFAYKSTPGEGCFRINYCCGRDRVWTSNVGCRSISLNQSGFFPLEQRLRSVIPR